MGISLKSPSKRLEEYYQRKIKIHESIYEESFQDAIIFGSGVMKYTILKDGTWTVYPINLRTEDFFEREYDHGNGD